MTETIPSLTRIGIIGDVHAEDTALEQVLDHFRSENVTTVLCTGDIVDGSGSVDRCCSLLQSVDAFTVRGNHDRWLFEKRFHQGKTERTSLKPATQRYLQRLRRTYQFSTPHGLLLLCHGIGDDDMALFFPDQDMATLEPGHPLLPLLVSKRYRFLVHGHTHVPMVRTLPTTTIINAGTLRSVDGPCFLIADFIADRLTFYDLNESGAITARDGVRLGI